MVYNIAYLSYCWISQLQYLFFSKVENGSYLLDKNTPCTKRLRYAAAPAAAAPQKKRHRLRKRFSGVVFTV